MNNKMTMYAIKGMMLEIDEKIGEIVRLHNKVSRLINKLDLEEKKADDPAPIGQDNVKNFTYFKEGVDSKPEENQEVQARGRPFGRSPSARVLRSRANIRLPSPPPKLPSRSPSPPRMQCQDSTTLPLPSLNQSHRIFQQMPPTILKQMPRQMPMQHDNDNDNDNDNNNGNGNKKTEENDQDNEIFVEVNSETVPSQKYRIYLRKGECTCPDFKYHGPRKCKHIAAVMQYPQSYGLAIGDVNHLKTLYP